MNKTNISREKYLKQVQPFIDKAIIKVFTGQRRVGKSYLMLGIIDLIKKSHPHSNIVYIDKESYTFDSIKNYHHLLGYLQKIKQKSGQTYLFIDEVQEIAGFEKAIRDLIKTTKYDIYLTGSNSQLLSSDLAGRLSGRYIEFRIHPLSYKEFLLFHHLTPGSDSLQQYIKYGGLPYLVNLELNDEQVYGYLKNVYDAVILKDVISRFAVRNVNFLSRLVEYLANNLGSLVSAKKISDFLQSQNIRLSPNTVLNYLSFLSSSFFINKTQRLDITGKKIFEIGEKYYFEDLGMRHVINSWKQVDVNKVLENLVYSKLVDAGYATYVGQLDKSEIDFVGVKEGKKIYVQVAYILSSEKVIKREFGNLQDIQDNYPKYVVTMDKMASGNVNGILHLGIIDFLMKNLWSHSRPL